VVLARK